MDIFWKHTIRKNMFIFQNFPGCEDIPPDVVEIIKTKMEVDVPLCRVKSGVDGLFVFPSIPSGEYTLVKTK